MIDKNLLDAIENNSPSLVEYSLNQGAKPCSMAMSLAAGKGNIEIFRSLIEAGADIDEGDYPSYMFAAKNNNWEIAKYICELKLKEKSRIKTQIHISNNIITLGGDNV